MLEWIVLGALAATAMAVFARIYVIGEKARAKAQADAAERGRRDAELDAFLAPYRERLEATRRQMARIALEPMAEDDVWVSKLGGRPYWPQGEALPCGEDGRPLVLLAQIALAELPIRLTDQAPTGILQFFIRRGDDYGANLELGRGTGDPLAQRNFRVVFWPDTKRAPEALSVEAPGDLPHDPHRPRRMRFTQDSEVLTHADHRLRELFDGDLMRAAEAFAAPRGIDPEIIEDTLVLRHDGSGHKVGGYPFFTQTDPRTDGQLELLLQLDTDEQMTWGDGGVGAFFIADADLARGDFSRVLYHWDSCMIT